MAWLRGSGGCKKKDCKNYRPWRKIAMTENKDFAGIWIEIEIEELEQKIAPSGSLDVGGK